jgi:hypothetical protein
VVKAIDTDMRFERSDAGFKITAGNEYEIQVSEGYIKSCTCMDFTQRGGPCKHMIRVWLETPGLEIEAIECTFDEPGFKNGEKEEDIKW